MLLTAGALATNVAVVAPAGTITEAGTVKGVEVDKAGRISQMLILKRSDVGAVSLMATVVPLMAVGVFCLWTQ